MAKSKYADEYRKQRRRIQNFLRRARQRGFDFPKFKLPDIPKKITKASVERLKKITPKKLYEKGVYKTLSGDIISAKQGQALRKQLAKNRRQETLARRRIRREPTPPAPLDEKILQLTHEKLDNWQPSFNWTPSLTEDKKQKIRTVRNMLEGAIREFGITEVARRMNSNAELWNKSLDKVLNDSGNVYRNEADDAMNTLAYILKGENLTKEEKMGLADIETWENEEYY